MKSLLITLLFLFVSCNCTADIPVREPGDGEGRPGWWWSCWADHIVAVEGVIRFEITDPPDLELKMSAKALRSHIKDGRVFQEFSKFFIADVRVDNLLFASPGITSVDSNVSRMKPGGVKSVKALIPTIQSGGPPPTAMALQSGEDNKGVFIFRYGNLVSEIPLVFVEAIPKEMLESAKAVFALRAKYDYRPH